VIHKIALAGFLLLAVLPLAADNTTNYILIVYPGYSDSDVAAQYGLTILWQIDGQVFKVSAAPLIPGLGAAGCVRSGELLCSSLTGSSGWLRWPSG